MAAKASIVEIFKGEDGRWSGHVKARNGKTKTPSQPYATKRSVVGWAERSFPELEVREIKTPATTE